MINEGNCRLFAGSVQLKDNVSGDIKILMVFIL